eukprot:g2754.t1
MELYINTLVSLLGHTKKNKSVERLRILISRFADSISPFFLYQLRQRLRGVADFPPGSDGCGIKSLIVRRADLLFLRAAAIVDEVSDSNLFDSLEWFSCDDVLEKRLYVSESCDQRDRSSKQLQSLSTIFLFFLCRLCALTYFSEVQRAAIERILRLFCRFVRVRPSKAALFFGREEAAKCIYAYCCGTCEVLKVFELEQLWKFVESLHNNCNFESSKIVYTREELYKIRDGQTPLCKEKKTEKRKKQNAVLSYYTTNKITAEILENVSTSLKMVTSNSDIKKVSNNLAHLAALSRMSPDVLPKVAKDMAHLVFLEAPSKCKMKEFIAMKKAVLQLLLQAIHQKTADESLTKVSAACLCHCLKSKVDAVQKMAIKIASSAATQLFYGHEAVEITNLLFQIAVDARRVIRCKDKCGMEREKKRQRISMDSKIGEEVDTIDSEVYEQHLDNCLFSLDAFF